MNPSAPQDPISPQEILTDALLQEHARLGGLDDDGLLANIRARTVARPLTVVEYAPPRRSQSRRPRVSLREWVQIAAIVALSFTVLGLLLSRHQVGSINGRTHQVITSAGVGTTEPDHSIRIAIAPAEMPKIDVPPGAVTAEQFRAAVLAEFSVDAESQSRLSPGLLVYEGDVILRHPDFVVKADRIELASVSPAIDAPVGTFTASGKSVRIEKRNSAGDVVEVARADRATYDAKGGRLILTGGATLSAGKSFVQPYSPEGEIVLRPNGYEVIEK